MTFQWQDLRLRKRAKPVKTTGKFRTRKQLEECVFFLRDQKYTYDQIAKMCLVSAGVVGKIITDEKKKQK